MRSVVEPLRPSSQGAGRPWSDHRGAIEGMVWKYRTGSPWRDVPARLGKWNSIYQRVGVVMRMDVRRPCEPPAATCCAGDAALTG
ncbi:transposase [Cellulomonas sp. Y8]|uniref:transposase n=1 Tax=Cellulomonas sp. Y8 TaxID=2591145 RepID=UPI00143D93CC